MEESKLTVGVGQPQFMTNTVGWSCPVCGRGLAPWVQVCPCRDMPVVPVPQVPTIQPYTPWIQPYPAPWYPNPVWYSISGSVGSVGVNATARPDMPPGHTLT